MRIRLDLDLQPAEVEALVRLALLHGFTRGDERKRWTFSEKQQAVREGLRIRLRDRGFEAGREDAISRASVRPGDGDMGG